MNWIELIDRSLVADSDDESTIVDASEVVLVGEMLIADSPFAFHLDPDALRQRQ